MNKMLNRTQVKFLIFLSFWCINTILFGLEVQAARSGEIPCSEGQVTWMIDDEGTLIFSGNGTTNIEGSWYSFWGYGIHLNKRIGRKVLQNIL